VNYWVCGMICCSCGMKQTLPLGRVSLLAWGGIGELNVSSFEDVCAVLSSQSGS